MKRAPLMSTVALLGWMTVGGVGCKGEAKAPPPPPPPEAASMIRIEPGSFSMGSPDGEPGRRPDELQHQVTLSAPFLLAAAEVTQAQWAHVSGANPSTRAGTQHPVENVSWLDAVRYCNRLSEAEGFTPAYVIEGEGVRWDRAADGYRLPTEAEWEYSCRAGATTPYAFGSCLSSQAGNCDTTVPPPECPAGTSAGRTMAVMSLRANAWGLYDMHGNVREWVWDAMAPYPTEPATDPAVDSADEPYPRRVERGGSWHSFVTDTRCAARDASPQGMTHDSVGFRVARSIHP